MIKPLASLSTRFARKVNRILRDYRPLLPATLLPEVCVTCLSALASDGLCQGCRSDLPDNECACHRCGLPLSLAVPRPDLVCGECLKHPPPFDRAFIPWRYQFPVDRMISRYKYHGQRHYARPLLADMTSQVRKLLSEQPERRPQLLVAAPMHPKRQRSRGFNQAADIAEAISTGAGIPWTDTLLTRTRAIRPQSGLNRRQRLSNLRELFDISGPVPRHVALVDDVVTTGATAATLAKLLRRQGARTIEIWALARTPAPGSPSGQSFSHMPGNGETGGQPR